MNKDFEQTMREFHKMAVEMACWEAGCRELFGNEDLNESQACKEIRKKGAQAIINKATWMCNVDTSKGYEEWLRQKIKADQLPEHVSLAAFTDIFSEQLKEIYRKEEKENGKADS